jgi:hypothetical protein
MPPPELAQYFAAERQGGFVLVALGLLSLGFAAYLWANRSAFLAMAWPLLVFGVLQIVIGLVVALRTPAQVAALDQGLRTSAAATVPAERARMTKVNASFQIIKAAEVAVIALGVLLVVLLPHSSAWAAVGLGLLVEATALLVFDAFAQHRAAGYTEWLAQLGG